ncbi:MAG TPA: hypothetical protein VFQ74_11605 [Pseudolysinimonas sp.]|nr:hypothetical protein [Pseudolysinimonas sp.]
MMPNDKTGDDGAAIDPRYDPAFQRGFDGEVATGPRGQSTLRRTAAVNPAPARLPAHPAEVVEPLTREEPQPLPAVFPMSETSGAMPADVASVSVVTPRELIRNPFMIALAALGALLILVGSIWAYEGFAAIVKNGGTRNEVEFWAAQTMSFGAPLAIVVGVAVAAVLLVLFARSWQRSR